MKKLFLVFALLSMFSLPAKSFGFGFEFSAGGWYQEPSGEMSFDKTTDVDDLDLKSDLGYDDKWQFTGRLKIDMPSLIPNLYFMYTPMKWSGTGSKDVDFSFGGENFRGDVDFDSELKMNHLDVAFYYGIPGVRAATADVLNIDLGLNFRLLDFKAEIEQDEIDEKESESFFLPIPMIYAAAQIKPINWVAFDLEGRGIAYSSHHYVSLIARVKVMPYGPLFVAGGYRYDNIKFDYDDVEVDAHFSGPLAEIGLEF